MEDRKHAKKIYEERREKLIREKKMKQEQMLRKEQETKERRQKKKSLEERWAMTRWITRYIDENSERWKKEQQERQENEVKLAEDWNRMKGLEKIRMIKERMEENKTVSINIRSPMIHLAEQQGGHQAEQPIQELDNDQAEQPEKAKAGTEEIQHQPDCQKDSQAEPHRSHSHDQASQPKQCEDQAEQNGQEDKSPSQTDSQVDVPCLDQGQRDEHADMNEGQAEQLKPPSPSSSPSTQPEKTIQPSL